MENTYIVTSWVDTQNRTRTSGEIVHANSISEAIKKFKQCYHECKTVKEIHKK